MAHIRPFFGEGGEPASASCSSTPVESSTPSSYAIKQIRVFSSDLRSFDKLRLVFDGTDLTINAGKLSAEIPLRKQIDH